MEGTRTMPGIERLRVALIAVPAFVAVLLLRPAIACAQTAAEDTSASSGSSERRAARAYEAARANPLDRRSGRG